MRKWISLCGMFLAFGLWACGPQSQIPQCQQDGDCSSGQLCKNNRCEKSEASVTPLTYTIQQQCAKIPMEEQQSWQKVVISAKTGTITVTQNLRTHCEAKLKFSLEKEGNKLKIIEENTGDLTMCTCGYELTMEIKNLSSGAYELEVWGVKSQQIEPKLLGSKKISL